jgi:hypothetical protein
MKAGPRFQGETIPIADEQLARKDRCIVRVVELVKMCAYS